MSVISLFKKRKTHVARNKTYASNASRTSPHSKRQSIQIRKIWGGVFYTQSHTAKIQHGIKQTCDPQIGVSNKHMLNAWIIIILMDSSPSMTW